MTHVNLDNPEEASRIDPGSSRLRFAGMIRKFVSRNGGRNTLARDLSALRNSGLFDTDWYLARNPDVARTGIDPLTHYLQHGASEGRDPNPLFDTAWYLAQYPDVAKAAMNPLLHYLVSGAAEGRDPGPRFDTDWYLAQNLDVMESGINPLTHYLRHGEKEGRKPRAPRLAAGRPKRSEQPVRSRAGKEGKSRPAEPQPLAIEEKYYFDLSAEPARCAPIKPIAFYLPQFHRIRENDEWWGEGFTEWTNTRRSRPRFEGHHQPRTPAHLGYYDLENVVVYAEQVKLAKKAGIYGFCFHFYWFAGKTLLEKPLRNVLANPAIDQPFCLCWANENWTRRWDGQDDEILIAQNHSARDAIEFLEHVNEYFKDDRYIRIDGKPLLVVYRPGIIPDIRRIQEMWRERAADLGWPGLYLVSAQTFGQKDPDEFGFDAAVQFPPHNQRHDASLNPTTPGLVPDFKGRIYDYRNMCRHFIDGNEPDYKLFRSVTLGWDNTARRRENPTVLHNFSLGSYAQWLLEACRATLADAKLDEHEKFVFINAWNEWAEGAYLEPDGKYGFGYLEATKKALNSCVARAPVVSVVVPNYNHAAFIARRLDSIFHQTRKPDEIIFLDDASSDGSVAVARDILSRSNIRYSIHRNEKNSGNVFKQWLQGVEAASGDLIWIAESDDEADLAFLENLLPQFDRDDVLLAYGDISYVTPDGAHDLGLSQYYNGLPDLSWESSHVVSASRAFAGAFAIKNIIPNASGAVFRKPTLTDEEKKRLCSYTFAGDWYFYAAIARGGSIAFCKEARAYFRLHPDSTSRRAFYSARHVAEHRTLMRDLNDMYRISAETMRRHAEALAMVLRQHPDGRAMGDLTGSFSLTPPGRRCLRICVASHSFAVGGGEVAPIDIANALRARGHHVTFLVLHKNVPGNPPVLRARLRCDIPVVYWDEVRDNFQDFMGGYGIEVFNSHNVGIEYALFRAGIPVHAAYVASLHGGYETVPGLLTREFIAYLQSNVDEWLYLADKNLEPLRSRGLTRLRATKYFNVPVPQPANAGSRLDIRGSLGAESGAVLLVIASRALHDKGWQLAIDATRRLRALTGRDCRLLLIGDGPDLAAIRDANADAGFVSFVGRVDNAFPVISECDIGVFPSTYAGESSPIFVLECLQGGLPVVASDIGEIRRIMTDIDGEIPGRIVSTSQRGAALVEQIAQAVADLIRDESKLIVARERARAVARRFEVHRLADLYIETMERQTQEFPVIRDPNTLYQTNHPVGELEFAEDRQGTLLVRGHVNPDAVARHGLDQVVILDRSNRFVAGVALAGRLKWSAEIAPRDLGSDNSCLELSAFAASATSNAIHPLQPDLAAQSVCRGFVERHLPQDSRDVPSIRESLRDLIIKATREPYVARSIHDSIATGNNYQTLVLDNAPRKGGRPTREKFLKQIEFRGKTVLDIGANTGENSRIARRLGATLVDGYEYDPYFVEIGRAVNALVGMTRVSLFQGDCTRPELFDGMKYDIVLALAVWVYMMDTIKQIAEVTDVLVFETHTLDHGIEFYYQPVLKHFPHAISLGYTELPADPHQSRMFVVFGKDKAVIEKLVERRFLRVSPYFDNGFIRRHRSLGKAGILALAKRCYEKHAGRPQYAKEDYAYESETYFEVFLAGLHQFSLNERKVGGLVDDDNLYLRFLRDGIEAEQLDQKLRKVSENPSWMTRKVSNKYEDAFNILNGHADRVAPVEIVPEPEGKLKFTSTNGEEFRCEVFDGHHRFFMCELTGAERIHFVVHGS